MEAWVWYLLIGIGVLVLLLIIFLIWYFWLRKKKTRKDNNGSPSMAYYDRKELANQTENNIKISEFLNMFSDYDPKYANREDYERMMGYLRSNSINLNVNTDPAAQARNIIMAYRQMMGDSDRKVDFSN